jgi:hypothetical protein
MVGLRSSYYLPMLPENTDKKQNEARIYIYNTDSEDDTCIFNHRSGQPQRILSRVPLCLKKSILTLPRLANPGQENQQREEKYDSANHLVVNKLQLFKDVPPKHQPYSDR